MVTKHKNIVHILISCNISTIVHLSTKDIRNKRATVSKLQRWHLELCALKFFTLTSSS